MAKKLDHMDLKQIIRLHLGGASNRKIADTLGISRNTVNQYMSLFISVEKCTCTGHLCSKQAVCAHFDGRESHSVTIPAPITRLYLVIPAAKQRNTGKFLPDNHQIKY